MDYRVCDLYWLIKFFFPCFWHHRLHWIIPQCKGGSKGHLCLYIYTCWSRECRGNPQGQLLFHSCCTWVLRTSGTHKCQEAVEHTSFYGCNASIRYSSLPGFFLALCGWVYVGHFKIVGFRKCPFSKGKAGTHLILMQHLLLVLF